MNRNLTILSDRSKGVMEVVNGLIQSWSYDLSTRKPGVAYVTPEGHPVTDLDLACFLSSLAQKRAVISIGQYTRSRAKQRVEGEAVLSDKNRHGRLNFLTSNQSVWSFGGNFDDANVITADSVGKARTFIFQGIDGEWYPGWDVIEILPTGLEKAVFDALSGKDGRMRFKHFIHPLRWTSLFGESFRTAKFAADYRLADELRFLKTEVKRLREELNIAVPQQPRSETVGGSRPKVVWAYESFVDGVDLQGEYTPYATTRGAYEAAVEKQKRLSVMQKILRFHVRATEFAWWRHMTKKAPEYEYLSFNTVCRNPHGDPILSTYPIQWVNTGMVEEEPITIPQPVWAKKWEWRHGVKDPAKPRGKSLFASMEMEEGVSYRFRVMPKTEQVAA